MADERYERIDATDGAGTFEAYCATPTGGSGPGILLFQEIFGINDNMRGLADRLAGEGYVVLVPDMFWRIEARFERKGDSGMGDAFGMLRRYDFKAAPADINATHAHLLTLPECTGRRTPSRCSSSGGRSARASRSRWPRRRSRPATSRASTSG
jgi:carboxymethylenebutenolidase